jgi:EGF-like domain
MCITSADCNHHGDCFSGTCFCDGGWFGSDCTTKIIDEYPVAFHVFIYFFAFIFVVLAIRSVYYIREAIQDK